MNLPRSLDETYERIFQIIPEEERQFVQSALLIICGNNDFRPTPISSNTLLKAIIFRLNSNEIEEPSFYDRSALRDRCGCLISLTVFKDTEHVSLAHYTVKEYLYSDRIRHSPVSLFALSRELVWTEFLRMVIAAIKELQTGLPSTNLEPLYLYSVLISKVYVLAKDYLEVSRTHGALADLFQSLDTVCGSLEYAQTASIAITLERKNMN